MQVTNVTVGYDRKRQPANYESAGAKVEFSAVLSASVGDTEDHLAVAAQLLHEAKTIVLVEIGLLKPGQPLPSPAAVNDLKPIEPAAAAVVEKPARLDTPNPAEPVAPVEPVKTEAVKPDPDAGSHGRRRKAKTETPAPVSAGIPLDEAPKAATPDIDLVKNVAGIPLDDSPRAAAIAETALGRTLPAKPAAASDIPLDEAPKPAAGTVPPAGIELTASAVQKFMTACMVQKKFLPQVVMNKMKTQYQTDRVHDLKPEQLAEFYAQLQELAGSK
jgi:outer membrane biosynthesis protein TonB